VRLVGPTGNANFPSMTGFFQREFGKGHGSFAYLSGLSSASEGSSSTSMHLMSMSPSRCRRWYGAVMA
jgi:hypothetical protein